MIRMARAVWWGTPEDGSGVLGTGSGALQETSFGFRPRSGEGPGANPEELIGAAHAASFSMAFSRILRQAGLVAERIDTRAEVTLAQVEDGCAITEIHLDVSAHVAGVENPMFQGLAHKARTACPVSGLLNARITVDARLLM